MNPLKEWRESQNLTQVEAAKALGLQQCEVSYYERGKVLPSARKVARLNRQVDGLGTRLALHYYEACLSLGAQS